MKAEYHALHFKTNYAFGGIFLLAASYHALGLFIPVNEAAIEHHALFVVLDLFSAYGFIRRPPYFNVFFALFTCQQYYTHGHDLVSYWTAFHQVHWISVLVLLVMPLALAKLLVDYFTLE